MDKIKNAVSGSSNSGNNNAQKEDYLDKGLDAAEQKWGGMSKEDTQRHRETNEKITDGARNTFEDATGKDVPHKISN